MKTSEFTIPPKTLIIPVEWPECNKPKDQELTNADLVKYTQALEEQLFLQEKNYGYFHSWRDEMIQKEKEVKEKQKKDK